MTVLWYGTSISEIDFTTVICPGSTYTMTWLDLIKVQAAEVELTTPLWIRITWTTIHNLQIDWISISILAHCIISAIRLGADQLEALSTGNIIVWVSLRRQGWPKLLMYFFSNMICECTRRLRLRLNLCVVIAVWSGKIPSQCHIGRILAE